KPGEEGSNNGVTVGVGVSVPGAVGEAKPSFTFEQNENGIVGSASVAVTFSEAFINSNALFAGLVHEGSHVKDMMDFRGGIRDALTGRQNVLNLSQYQTEYNA